MTSPALNSFDLFLFVKAFDGAAFQLTGYQFAHKRLKENICTIEVVSNGNCDIFLKGVPYKCALPFTKGNVIAIAIMIENNVDICVPSCLMRNLFGNLIDRPKHSMFYSQDYMHVYLMYTLRSIALQLEDLKIRSNVGHLQMVDYKNWILKIKTEGRTVIIIRESTLLSETIKPLLYYPNEVDTFYLVVCDRWAGTMGAALHMGSGKTWLGKSTHFLLGKQQQDTNDYLCNFDHSAIDDNMLANVSEVTSFACIIPSAKNPLHDPIMLLQCTTQPWEEYLNNIQGHRAHSVGIRSIETFQDITQIQTVIDDRDTYYVKDGFFYYNTTKICKTKSFVYRSTSLPPSVRELKCILENKNTTSFLAFYESQKLYM